MPKKKKAEGSVPMILVKKGKKEVEVERWYKGYDIKWLKQEKEFHPDGKLVDEFEKKFGIIL